MLTTAEMKPQVEKCWRYPNHYRPCAPAWTHPPPRTAAKNGQRKRDLLGCRLRRLEKMRKRERPVIELGPNSKTKPVGAIDPQ